MSPSRRLGSHLNDYQHAPSTESMVEVIPDKIARSTNADMIAVAMAFGVPASSAVATITLSSAEGPSNRSVPHVFSRSRAFSIK
jgi:hypothetical protein